MVRLRALYVAYVLARPQLELADVGLTLTGVGSVGTAINIVTTALTMRCTGVTLGRMPLFAWLNLILKGCFRRPAKNAEETDGGIHFCTFGAFYSRVLHFYAAAFTPSIRG